MTDSMNVRLTNDVAELPRLARFIQEFCERYQVPASLAFAFNLALEEAVTNVIGHGYDDAGVHEIDVRMSLREGAVTAEITDDGRRFDPRQAKPPDVTAGITERPIGGLGVFLITKVMDEVQYRVEDGRNRLTLSKRLPVSAP